MPKNYADALLFFASALLGFACVVVPPLIARGDEDQTQMPHVRYAIEHARPISAIGLFVTGLVLGYLRPMYWHLLGLTTVAIFPVITFIEIMADPRSHNLWPIELAIYGLFALPGFFGAWLGSLIGRARSADLMNE